MGRPKQLLPLPGGTVLSTVVSRLLEAPVDRVVVVLGHEAEAIARQSGLPRNPRVQLAVNPDWRDGMSSSLRCGLRACADAEAVLVALGDQPGIDPEVVGRLVEAHRMGAPLAIPVSGERTGHPVLFSQTLFPALAAVTGDVGAREVVLRHWSEAAQVPACRPADLDTQQEYEAFLASLPHESDHRGR